MKRGLHERGGWVSQVFFVMSLLSLGMGLFLLGWAVWPVPTDGVEIPISKGILPGAPSGTDYASLADYTLNLSWPRWLRVGDEGEIILTITSEAGTQEEEAEEDVQIVVGEPYITGLALSPPAATQASLNPGNDMGMAWKVSSDMSGEYPGKVMLSFGFYYEEDGLYLVPVAVVDTLIIITDLWGMGSGLALWLGLVGLMMWGGFFLLGRIVQAKGK